MIRNLPLQFMLGSLSGALSVNAVASGAGFDVATDSGQVPRSGFEAAAESGHLSVSMFPVDPEGISELILQDDKRAPLAVVSALRQSSLPQQTLFELLLLAERVQIADPEVRSELLSLLLTHARLLRDATEAAADPPLWTAIRRFASLAPPNRAADLLDFLRPQDSATIRQSALLGLYSILEFRSLPCEGDQASADALRFRLAELSKKYLDPDWLVSGQNTALAIAAFTATVLAEAPSASSLADSMKATARQRLIRRAYDNLKRACHARTERGVAIPSLLKQAMKILSEGFPEGAT